MVEKFSERAETDILKPEDVASSGALLKVLDDGDNIRNGHCEIRVPVSSDRILQLIIESQKGISAIGSGQFERIIEVTCADGYVVEMTLYRVINGGEAVRYLHRSAFSRKTRIHKPLEVMQDQEPEEEEVDRVRFSARDLLTSST